MTNMKTSYIKPELFVFGINVKTELSAGSGDNWNVLPEGYEIDDENIFGE